MKDEILYTDWQKIDVRLGRVESASNPDWSNKLIELQVDFGEEIGKRTIFTGLRAVYTPEEFVGKQCLFLVNLPPKKMGEQVSHGMILAVDPAFGSSNSKPVVLMFEDIAPVGSSLA